MILGWCKILNCTPKEVIYDISFANLLLYSAANPTYDSDNDKWDDSLDANNPNNFQNINTEEIYIR